MAVTGPLTSVPCCHWHAASHFPCNEQQQVSIFITHQTQVLSQFPKNAGTRFPTLPAFGLRPAVPSSKSNRWMGISSASAILSNVSIVGIARPCSNHEMRHRARPHRRSKSACEKLLAFRSAHIRAPMLTRMFPQVRESEFPILGNRSTIEYT